MDLLFNDAPGANSMRNFYIEQSSNRYTVHGDVTDWVPVPGNAVDYDDNPDANVWIFLQDSVNGWYNAQIAAGKTPAQINAYLSQFDVWDRYDYNGNGNFDEPDGYIDTFQSVHAGEGEEAGGGALALRPSGATVGTPTMNWRASPARPSTSCGGIQIGNSDYWVGKYTIQPENGGVGVFTHEYGHDLGLPDLYDYLRRRERHRLLDPDVFRLLDGRWHGDDRLQVQPHGRLGEVPARLAELRGRRTRVQKSEHKLGPMESNTKQAQGLFVVLPQKAVTAHIAEPYAGSYFYFSGSANNLNN